MSAQNLLTHPYRLLVSGRSKSGKTTLTVRMVLSDMVWGKFEELYVVCPTYDQPTYDELRPYVTSHFKHATDETFDLIRRRITRKNSKALLLIDDCAASTDTNKGRKGGLADIANNARWVGNQGLSMIIITQNMSSITPSFRDNADANIMFPTLNLGEIEYVLKERNPTGKKEMLDILRYAHKGHHSFLFIVITDYGVQLWKRFDEHLLTA